MYSTKQSENKEAEYIFCNGIFSEDKRREIWIQCSTVLSGHTVPEKEGRVYRYLL